MKKDDWRNLPKSGVTYTENDFGRLKFEMIPTDGGSFLSFVERVKKKWAENREEIIKDKEQLEDLAALLITIAASFMSKELHLPARLSGNSQNNAVDRAVFSPSKSTRSLPTDMEWSALQIVSTQRIELDKDRDIVPAILARIELKHSKGRSYSEGIQLVVIVTQSDWKVDMRVLKESLRNNRSFASYWVVLPFNSGQFIVEYVADDPNYGGNGQTIIDLGPPIAANYAGLVEKGEKLIPVAELVSIYNTST